MVTRGPDGTAAVHRMIASPGVGAPTALRIMLGAQLRRLREAKRITLEDAGYVIRASGSKMSRLETGRVGFKPRDIADLLTFYGVTDDRERETLQELARQASARGWWHDYADIMPAWFEPYVGLEEAASSIRCYEIQFVPGLLQTPDYARAVTAVGFPAGSAAEIDRRVSLRMARQAVLTRPTRPHLWLVLDEAALRRPVGLPTSCAASSGTSWTWARGPTSASRSSRWPGARTPRREARSRSCASASRTCPMSSISSSSPALFTWTSGRRSTTTWP